MDGPTEGVIVGADVGGVGDCVGLAVGVSDGLWVGADVHTSPTHELVLLSQLQQSRLLH